MEIFLTEPLFTSLLKYPVTRGRGSHQLPHPTSVTPNRSGIGMFHFVPVGNTETIFFRGFPVRFSKGSRSTLNGTAKDFEKFAIHWVPGPSAARFWQGCLTGSTNYFLTAPFQIETGKSTVKGTECSRNFSVGTIYLPLFLLLKCVVVNYILEYLDLQ